MPTLEVPGALLYYEIFGSGPLLLLIPGADGRGSVFHPVAQHLATNYTVICWDRRGYSRSQLLGAQNFSERLSTDATDASRLIQHLSPDSQSASAVVFGTSSGAVVAQKLLSQHPECVRKLIAHEPPAFNVLPAPVREFGASLINHVYEVYRKNGPISAMETFTSGLSEGQDKETMLKCMDWSRSDEIRANSTFWFEFELRQYPLSDVDMQVFVRENEKYFPAAGHSSGDGPGVGPISTIAKAVNKDIWRLPGGHVGYMTDSEEWAASFLSLTASF